MKHLMLLAALVSIPAHASDIDFWLDIHVRSIHPSIDVVYPKVDGVVIDEPMEPNESNFGIGLSFPIGEHTELRTGFFQNTWDITSFYGAAHWHTGGPVAVGLTLGLVTGYDETPQTEMPLMPMAVPTVMFTASRARAEVGYIPPLAGLYEAITFTLGVAF